MDPTTTAHKEKIVDKVIFVDMDQKSMNQNDTKSDDRQLTAKEKKAAYMREYYKRKQAEKKAAKVVSDNFSF